MNDVIGGVRGIAAIMNELQQAFEQQDSDIEQVNAVAHTMSESTRQNSQLVDSMADSAAALRDRGAEMNDIMAQFDLAPARSMPQADFAAPQPRVAVAA